MAAMMTRHVMIESPTMNRRQPLLYGGPARGKDDNNEGNGRKIGEVAGGTTAECAAVCCCCPCAMMHLLVLAVYKVPTGLCRKALKKNKRRRLLKRKKKNLLDENQRPKMQNHTGPDGTSEDDDDDDGDGESSDGGDDKGVGVMDAVDLDSEMWDRFYGAGFWRSFSQRED